MKQTIALQKCIALFMIVLIIGLPVYSSRVMAVNAVRIASIEGDDGFTEFRKRIDTTVMNVEVDLDGAESLSGNQLRTRINGNGPFLLFGQCSGSGGSFNCVSDRENILPGGTFSYQVNLFDEDGNYAGAQDTATIIVDDQAPTVTLFDVEPELGASSNVNVSFSLEDGAYATNNNDCVGLKKLEIRQDDLAGNLLNTVNIDNAPCDFTGNMTVSVPSGDGDFRLCVQAFDRFDQKSSGLRCDDFTVDSSLPQIESSALIDFNGKPIEFIGGNVIGASLIVNITDNDLIETSVKADLTDLELFPDTPRSSCQKIGTDKHKCLWNFNLILYETKAPIVQINAVDRAGNKLEAPVTLGTITRDIEGPIVTDITTSLGEFNGTNIIGDDFNFTATIDDVVGVSEGKVFLDLSGIGLGDNVKASSCTANSCTWVIGDINLGSGKTAKVKSTFTTRDDLGNAASEIKEIEVLVDKSKPKIINLEVNVVPGQVPLPEGFAIKGDVLSITANLTEETSVDAQLVTTIFGDVGPLEGNCQATTEENNHVCTWETPPIDISGPLNAQLFFTFTDFVGNAKGAQEQLFISRSDEDPDPNFYMSTVQCSPQFIDRQISEKLSVREYCHVTLSAVGVKAKPLITELAECTGDDMAFVNDVILSNEQTGSFHPLLTVELQEVNFEDTAIFNISCELDIISEIGSDAININPEREFVNIIVPVSNFPLGEFSEKLEDQIIDAIDDAKGPFWNTIGMLKKIFDYAKKICYLFSAFANLKSLYHEIQAIMSGAALSLSATPLGPGAEAGRVAQATSTESFTVAAKGVLATAQKFCLFLNCQLGPQAPGMSSDPKKRDKKVSGGGLLNFFGGGGGFGFQPRNWGAIPMLTKGDAQTKLSPQWIEAWTGRPIESYLNGRDSIIVALLTLCIPGIIYGIDRYRQINCMYALCLQSHVDSNIPADVCEKQKDYLTCKFVFGEIFAAIPFTAFFNYYIQLFKQALLDPLSMSGVVIGFICAPTIPGGPYAYNACAFPRAISLLGQAIQDVTSILDFNFWKIQTDYCDMVETADEFFDDDDDEVPNQ